MKKLIFKGPMNEIECQQAFDEWYREEIEGAPTVTKRSETLWCEIPSNNDSATAKLVCIEEMPNGE